MGLAAAAASLAAMVALCGFLADAVVARTVDGGQTAPVGTAIAIDLALVLLFGLQHSLMARGAFKRAWRRVLPRALERSAYAMAASLVLALLIVLWRPIPAEVWRLETPALRACAWTAFAGGWLLMVAAALAIDPLALAGIRVRERPFQVTGLHRYVRHPTYLGWIVAVWSAPTMTAGHLLLAASTSLYVLVAIRFEERDLLREHGEAYERYRRAVPMLVPWPGRAHPRVAPR